VGEAVGDRAGCSLASGDVDGDGVGDVLVGACGQDAGGTDSGAAYLVLGPATGTVDLSAADTKFVGESERDEAGYALATGDVDGDGIGDILVGAYGQDAGGSYSGAAYLVLGPTTGWVDLSSAADAKFVGEVTGDFAGCNLASGDIDGDGVGDVLVGAYGQDADGTDSGAAYLVLGPATGTVDLSEADAKFVGEEDADFAGSSLTVGDIDGDGVGDVLVGAHDEDEGGSNAGAAYLLFGGGL